MKDSINITINIIGLLGSKKSGKDSAGKYLIEKHGFTRYAFGDPVKKICACMFSLSDNQLNEHDNKELLDSRWGLTPREMFQRVGTDFGQYSILKLFPELEDYVNHRELWCKLFEYWLEDHVNEMLKNNIDKPTINNDRLSNQTLNIVITDVRFQHEINCITRNGGKIVKITRDTKLNDSHISEKEIDTIPFESIDSTIDNNGTLLDLYSQLDLLFKDLL
jgi:dephospho-CoA kinase